MEIIKHGEPEIANIWLNKYSEIFSDFDSSPYNIRTVSDDFINQTKKIFREKSEIVKEFNLFLPTEIRDRTSEDLIIKRLHSYFQNKLLQTNLENKLIKRKGILFTACGIILLVLLTFLLSYHILPGVFQYVFIVTEPAGWFLIWMGLDYIFFENKSKKADREFYKKFSRATISFHSTS